MNSPFVHLQQPVAAPGQTAVMRGHHQSHALGGHQFKQQLKDSAARVFIERAGRFVGEQDLRTIHQRAAERGALALAAGELLDALIAGDGSGRCAPRAGAGAPARCGRSMPAATVGMRQFSSSVRSGMRLCS